MTLQQTFIVNLKDYRKKEGLSQMQLAEYCGISHGYIAEIETGKKFPSIGVIEKIAVILRVEPYLFFKNKSGDSGFSEGKKERTRLPYSINKQLQKQLKTRIKKQVNQSASQIFSEITDIVSKY